MNDMKNFFDIGLQIPDLLLPAEKIDAKKWAIVACDQFTSEPEYWKSVEEFVGDAPSTLKMILPEVYLETGDTQKRIETTQAAMRDYQAQGVFTLYEGLILVERTLVAPSKPNHKVKRYGLMVALDLEQYDFSVGSQSLIRATEGTIIDRLPPRMKIRRGAPIELPHILVLIDDPALTVIEPLVAKTNELPVAYDTELFGNGGHLTGYQVSTKELQKNVVEALRLLATPEKFAEKYDLQPGKYGTLLYAMGDGNHSLATAKSIWEELKHQVGLDHPARYALVELENIHSPALNFEPIHRVLMNVTADFFTEFSKHETFSSHPFPSMKELTQYVDTIPADDTQRFGVISPAGYIGVSINQPSKNLPVGTLQAHLDTWKALGGFEAIDYVHGTSVVNKLAKIPGNMGFYLPAMEKSELFKTVILDGSLPRKTFSMGEAHEKRYYFECRKITTE
jgi:hypothetical protein